MLDRWSRLSGNNKPPPRLHRVTVTDYSEKHWFCAKTGRPVTARDETGRFVNPWCSQSATGVQSVSSILLWQWQRFVRECKELVEKICGTFRNTLPDAESVLVATPEPSPAENATQSNKSAVTSSTVPPPMRSPLPLRFTWIGHSTCLVQCNNISVLTDPIFSQRASPFQNSFIGMARVMPPALEHLPGTIDVCLISHDHYDHLDKLSVLRLRDTVKMWVVPLGLQEWLEEKCDVPAHRIVELEWWESAKLLREAGGKWAVVDRHSAVEGQAAVRHPAFQDPAFAEPIDDSMWLTCCPTQHWASRTFFDRNYRLWCSFAVLFPGYTKFFFAGDTALPKHFPLFDLIRDYLGGRIDLAALPIGAYEPAFFMRNAHLNPEEAVKVHQALDAIKSVGVHWGTFALSEEPMEEPPIKLREAAAKAGVDFVTIRHGESITEGGTHIAGLHNEEDQENREQVA
jgi:N-acyl-phosphatidylethanolamine-hydrolysing phospholipase D